MARIRSPRNSRCCDSFLNSLCGGTDYIDHHVGVGEHRDVAAGDLRRGGAHTLREEALQIGMHSVVVLADDVPAWLRLPSGPPDFRVEQVWNRHALSRPNEFLLLLRKISAEIFRALGTQPDTSIHDFDVGEDVRLGE